MNVKLLNVLLIGSIVSLVMMGSCKKDDPTPTPPSTTPETGVFTDSRDGKEYKWVKIGDLTWMAENLAYQPSGSTGYLAYDNDINNGSIYGYLYTYEKAKVVVPDGWRLPTEDDFYALVNELGGDVPAYNKLLESGTAHWLSPNDATNKSGFTALPAGYYDKLYSEFRGIHEWTAFVSSSLFPNSTTSVIVLNLNRNFKKVSIQGNPLRMYYSIRCVKE